MQGCFCATKKQIPLTVNSGSPESSARGPGDHGGMGGWGPTAESFPLTRHFDELWRSWPPTTSDVFFVGLTGLVRVGIADRNRRGRSFAEATNAREPDQGRQSHGRASECIEGPGPNPDATRSFPRPCAPGDSLWREEAPFYNALGPRHRTSLPCYDHIQPPSADRLRPTSRRPAPP